MRGRTAALVGADIRDGGVQRYIEEFRDIEEPPIYLPGDKIACGYKLCTR